MAEGECSFDPREGSGDGERRVRPSRQVDGRDERGEAISPEREVGDQVEQLRSEEDQVDRQHDDGAGGQGAPDPGRRRASWARQCSGVPGTGSRRRSLPSAPIR